MLLLGDTGLIGKSLVERSPNYVSILGASRGSVEPLNARTDHIQLDVRDNTHLTRVVGDFHPDVIIHAASDGRVDIVENAESETLNNVRTSLMSLTELCAERDIQLVYLSSNAVYGSLPGPYSEASPYSPMNAYGRAKVAGEEVIAASPCRSLMLRPIMLFGWPLPHSRPNLFSTWWESLDQGHTVRVVTDVYTQPLFSDDFADLAWAAITAGMTGSLNMAGDDYLSLFDFALAVADAFDCDPQLIEPALLNDFHALAARPLHTQYDLTLAKEELSFRPTPLHRALALLRQRKDDAGDL